MPTHFFTSCEPLSFGLLDNRVGPRTDFDGPALSSIAVREHEVTLDPPLDLTRNCNGRMVMRTNPHNAVIAGPYTLADGERRLYIDEVKIPNQRNIGGWTMMKVLGCFEKWPKGYEFTAHIEGETI